MICKRCGENFDVLVQCVHQTESEKKMGDGYATFTYLCYECVTIVSRSLPVPPANSTPDMNNIIPSNV